MSDEYIKEGDLILVQLKDQIKQVYVADISPSGTYMRVTANSGHFSAWINTINHLETIVSVDDDEEYEDVEYAEEEEDLIGGRTLGGSGGSRSLEAEIITESTLAKFDERNKRK